MKRLHMYSDNLTFVPASQLPFKAEWDRLAATLPWGDALFVVPQAGTPLARSAEVISAAFKSRGRRTHVRARLPRSLQA